MSFLLFTFCVAVLSSSVLPFLGTPYALGSTFMLCLLFISTYTISVGPLWFPAVMFLIYVGALMVLFLYMSCLSPNTRIKSLGWGLFIMLLVLGGVLLFLCYPEFLVIQCDVSVGGLVDKVSSVESPSDLGTFCKGDLLVFCGVLLFFGLLSIVKICKFQAGPLRPFKRGSGK
uniref:NADH dehydrogenase subunit 6 n=1 Tax=Lottia goshimai TaxID=1824450 RepID=UPI002114494B|nr:NADH dehydrogenase subunit 6 [Lottia goshimai]UTM92225.1 NADH dehydrogenase subunit 6 [Lottia peitaihoensis]